VKLNNTAMRIIFLGTPDFAVPSLDILVANGYNIAAVITAPGKPAGRGLQIKESPIKKYADIKGIPAFQPVRLSDPEFLASVKALHADLQIVVAFRMMPQALWQMPPLGTFNLHGSLLPHYRGAAPINRAIMNGETETGVTTFFLKQEIDTGNIIFRDKITISPNETAGELHDRMMVSGAGLVLKTVQAIESGKVILKEQNEFILSGESLKSAPKIYNADCKIDWNLSRQTIHNQVRGLSPFPGAFTHLVDAGGTQFLMKIFRTQLVDADEIAKAGTIRIFEKKLLVFCNDGPIEILELQQEGKKRIPSPEFIKGFRMEKGWRALTN